MLSVELRVVALAGALVASGVHAQVSSAARAMPAALGGAAKPAVAAPAPAPAAAPVAKPALTAVAPASAPAAHAAPAAPARGGRDAKEESHPIPADATIGTITELARQLKVQQLRKELREAGKDQAGNASTHTSEPDAPLPRASKKAPVAVAPLQPPAVEGIFGSGGTRRAEMYPSRAELAEGQVVTSTMLGTEATVVSIGRNSVVFRVCELKAPQPAPGKHGRTQERRCETKTVTPSSM